AKSKAEFAKIATKVRRLGGVVLGNYPWFQEDATQLVGAKSSAPPIDSLDVTLVSGAAEQSGSTNPIYLTSGGRKYVLASEFVPLKDGGATEVYHISKIDLEFDPLTRDDLKDMGIGMVGSHRP